MKEYKVKVKAKVRAASFKHLMELQNNHSKMDNINYSEFKLSNYMRNPLFDYESTTTLFSLRTRTVRGIKNDFRGMYVDIMCPLGCTNTDTIPHILECVPLQQSMISQNVAKDKAKYEDIFSPDVIEQKQVTELFIQLLEIGERILNSPPVAVTGPMH